MYNNIFLFLGCRILIRNFLTDNFDNDVHICFTNDKRKHINHIKMKQLAKKTKKCLKLPAQKHCEKSQDVFLNVSMAVISKINNQSMNIYNK